MIYFSFFFIEKLEFNHLKLEMNTVYASIETALESDQNELENILYFISNRIRSLIIERDATFLDIDNYIKDVTSYFRDQRPIHGFESAFALLFVFENQLCHGLHDSDVFVDFDFASRDWYYTSLSNPVNIAETKLYTDAVSGEITFTLVKNIYDENGSRIAIICIDVTIARLFDFLYNSAIFTPNSWMLIDKNHNIISHTNNDFIGKKLSEINRAFSRLSNYFNRRGVLEKVFIRDSENHRRLVSIKEIKPELNLVIAISAEAYENNLRSMLTILIMCGSLFSALLILILMTLMNHKNKSIMVSKFLQMEREILLTSIDFLPIAAIIYRTDDDTIVYANQSTLKLFGAKSLEFEVIGKNYSYFIPSTGENVSQSEVFNDYSLHGYQIPIVVCCKKLNGETSYVSVSSQKISFSGENCILSAFEDISSHREYQEKLLVLVQREKEHNHFRSKFFASVADEIRTPINAILVLAEMQLSKQQMSEKEKTTFSRIYNSGCLLLKIVTDILDITKIEEGIVEIVPIEYDLIALVNEIIYNTHLRYINKPVNFKVAICPDTPAKLIGDEVRIKQILNYMLSNAFKFTIDGQVSLSISSTPSGGDILLTLTISDTGQGMTPEQQSKLFMEFSRFPSLDDIKVVGTGLGLYIAKKFIDEMNGSVMVDSTAGVGSTFTIQLPQGVKNAKHFCDITKIIEPRS
jgi:PAS domain S-box-containing protein